MYLNVNFKQLRLQNESAQLQSPSFEVHKETAASYCFMKWSDDSALYITGKYSHRCSAPASATTHDCKSTVTVVVFSSLIDAS